MHQRQVHVVAVTPCLVAHNKRNIRRCARFNGKGLRDNDATVNNTRFYEDKNNIDERNQ